MAIYSMSVSDDTINALLQSPEAGMRALGQQYKDEKAQQDKELGRDKGFMGAVSNIFGFGSAQGAEPGTGQRYNNQFSVTQEPQFNSSNCLSGCISAKAFNPFSPNVFTKFFNWYSNSLLSLAFL